MPKVPYTRAETLTQADIEYLGDRVSNSPAIAQLLGTGKTLYNQRQLIEKLDDDTGLAGSAVTTGDPDDSYSNTVLDESAT